MQYGQNQEKNSHYSVDLTNMLQTNQYTGTIRRIRRSVDRVEIQT